MIYHQGGQPLYAVFSSLKSNESRFLKNKINVVKFTCLSYFQSYYRVQGSDCQS